MKKLAGIVGLLVLFASSAHAQQPLWGQNLRLVLQGGQPTQCNNTGACLYSLTTGVLTLGQGGNQYIDIGGTGAGTARMVLHDGQSAGLSAAGTAILRYNNNTGHMEWSLNTAAFHQIADLATTQTYTAAQNTTAGTLTDAATITTDASTSNTFTVTLAGNRTLANPTNLGPAGSYYQWLVTQDAGGSRTLAYGNLFTWLNGGATPVLSTTPNATDVITCVYNGTVLVCQFASATSSFSLPVILYDLAEWGQYNSPALGGTNTTVGGEFINSQAMHCSSIEVFWPGGASLTLTMDFWNNAGGANIGTCNIAVTTAGLYSCSPGSIAFAAGTAFWTTAWDSSGAGKFPSSSQDTTPIPPEAIGSHVWKFRNGFKGTGGHAMPDTTGTTPYPVMPAGCTIP